MSQRVRLPYFGHEHCQYNPSTPAGTWCRCQTVIGASVQLATSLVFHGQSWSESHVIMSLCMLLHIPTKTSDNFITATVAPARTRMHWCLDTTGPAPSRRFFTFMLSVFFKKNSCVFGVVGFVWSHIFWCRAAYQSVETGETCSELDPNLALELPH